MSPNLPSRLAHNRIFVPQAHGSEQTVIMIRMLSIYVFPQKKEKERGPYRVIIDTTKLLAEPSTSGYNLQRHSKIQR